MDLHELVAAWRSAVGQLAVRRRLVVAVLTGIAVLAGLSAMRPSSAPTARIWVAARDLSGGAPLARADVAVERLPVSDVPDDALAPADIVVGRLLAAPMRRGEPLTDVRLLSTSLLTATGAAGDVAVPVRVADGPAAAALVHAGNVVDVIAAGDTDSGAPAADGVIVRDVRVLATPTRDDGSNDGGDSAGLLIVEATSAQAATLAQAADGARLSVAVQRGS
jgi:pilus assembly protein CpaB